MRLAACCQTAAARTVDHRHADLFTPVRGQTVEEPRLLPRRDHECVVDRVAREHGQTRRVFRFLTHRCPDVGVDRIGTGDRFVRIGDQLDDAAEVAGPLDREVVELVPRR